MKIISIDNFGREDISDTLIAENVDEYWSIQIAKLLNKNFSGNEASYFFKAVEDDHKLYEFEP